MATLQPRDKVLVKNFKTGNVTTIFYYKAINRSYMKMCDLVAVDPRMTGELPSAPPTPKKTAEQQVKELQNEMGVTQEEAVEGIEFVETPKITAVIDLDSMDVKQLKAEADKLGITYAKTAGKAKMLELLK